MGVAAPSVHMHPNQPKQLNVNIAQQQQQMHLAPSGHMQAHVTQAMPIQQHYPVQAPQQSTGANIQHHNPSYQPPATVPAPVVSSQPAQYGAGVVAYGAGAVNPVVSKSTLFIPRLFLINVNSRMLCYIPRTRLIRALEPGHIW